MESATGTTQPGRSGMAGTTRVATGRGSFRMRVDDGVSTGLAGGSAGVSTGAIASIAVRIANELDEGNVVFIVCDDGWKYLSSGLYSTPVEELENLDTTVCW